MRLKSFNRLNAFRCAAQPRDAEGRGVGSDERRIGSRSSSSRAIRRCRMPCRKHPFRRLYSADQALRDRAIMRFASSQQDGEKAPFSICECVYLRVAPSARAANSLLLLLSAAAERCAFMCVESIICVSVDRPFPASSRNRFSQTPRRAQRTKRL